MEILNKLIDSSFMKKIFGFVLTVEVLWQDDEKYYQVRAGNGSPMLITRDFDKVTDLFRDCEEQCIAANADKNNAPSNS